MRNTNYEMLNDLLKDRLEIALSGLPNEDDYNSKAFSEAMKLAETINVLDRNNIEMAKLEKELVNKLEIEDKKNEVQRRKNELEINAKKEVDKEKLKLDSEKIRLENQKSVNNYNLEQDKLKTQRLLKILEVTAAVILTPMIDNKFRTKFAKMICNFEKDYNFTTTAGRSLTKLFKL